MLIAVPCFPKTKMLAVVTIELEANNSIGGLKDSVLLRSFENILENQCLINMDIS